MYRKLRVWKVVYKAFYPVRNETVEKEFRIVLLRGPSKSFLQSYVLERIYPPNQQSRTYGSCLLPHEECAAADDVYRWLNEKPLQSVLNMHTHGRFVKRVHPWVESDWKFSVIWSRSGCKWI